MSDVAQLTAQLVRFPSVSRVSNLDVAQFVADRLRGLNFTVEEVPYNDAAGVPKLNLVARRGPDGGSGLAYLAHNDVVPADDWDGLSPGAGSDSEVPACGPFEPYDVDGRMYGRGTCDMKGSLAAMLTATERIDSAKQKAPIWIVVTADEEVGFAGAKHVVGHSKLYREMVQAQPMSIIGEPTQLEVVHAHKGIRGFEITSHGRAAHSSSREGVNATLAMVPMLAELKSIYDRTESDTSLHDTRYDPPTLTWNMGIRGGDTAINVTPPLCKAWVSLRTMPDVDGESLVMQAKAKAEELGLEFKTFDGSGPMWVDADRPIVTEMLRLTKELRSQGGPTTDRPAKTVCYGTDGGVFTELRETVVCGPGDIAQAHTVDEWVSLQQLELGVDLYENAIRNWCY